MYIQYSITCDDGVSFIVESTTEYLIAVTFQNLQALASSCTP